MNILVCSLEAISRRMIKPIAEGLRTARGVSRYRINLHPLRTCVYSQPQLVPTAYSYSVWAVVG